MFCNNCGKENTENNKFCGECGTILTDNTLQLKKKKKIPTKVIIVLISFLFLAIISVSSIYIYNFVQQQNKEEQINNEKTEKDAIEQKRIEKLEYELTAPNQIYNVAASGYLAIKKILKNPESIQLHEVKSISSGDNIYTYAFDISAQNGFGGLNRAYYYISNNEKDANSYIKWDSELKIAYAPNYSANNLYNKYSMDTKLIMDIVNYRESKK